MNITTLKTAWDKACAEETVWDRLTVKEQQFFFRTPDTLVPLSSFAREKLPPIPADLPPLGRFLARMSAFANIGASRPGTEEVTFYSLIGKPHGTGMKRLLDRFFLRVGSSPLNWRRRQVEQFIKQKMFGFLSEKEDFGFLDIGSGGGFDSLEIARLVSSIADKGDAHSRISIVNVDIDTFWLKQNEKLSDLLYKGKPPIVRRNMSVFDYLDNKTYMDDFPDRSNLVISCNGFAEFFEDELLRSLFSSISRMTSDFTGRVSLIIPFAVKNRLQEFLSRMVGFNYLARDIADISNMIQDNFPGFSLEVRSQFSQMIFLLHRKASQ